MSNTFQPRSTPTDVGVPKFIAGASSVAAMAGHPGGMGGIKSECAHGAAPLLPNAEVLHGC